MALSFLDILGAERAQAQQRRGTPFEHTISSLPKTAAAYVSGWPQATKEQTILRASGMDRLCPREFVLNYWHPTAGNFFDFMSYMKMGVGTHLHSFLQDNVLGPAGVLWGHWHNNHTNEIVEGFHPEPRKSVAEFVDQKLATWTYVEPKVWEPHYRISGHIDGLLSKDRMQEFHRLVSEPGIDFDMCIAELASIPCGDKVTLEIKTTSSRLFYTIESAKDIASYYVTQSTIYQKLAGVTETMFWFFERNDLASKTLLMPHNDLVWQEVLRKGGIVWEAIRDQTLPESMRKCMLRTDARAKDCPHATPCFEAKYDMATHVATTTNTQLLDLTGWTPKLDVDTSNCILPVPHV